MAEHVSGGTEEKGVQKELGILERIIGVFVSPRQTFESINRKPNWLVPFILITIVVVVSSFLVRDVAIQEQIARIENNPDIPPETAERIIERMETQGFTQYIGYIFMPIGILVVLAAVSGVLMFGGNVILGGDASYKKIFSVYAYTGLIGIAAAIIKTPLILARGATDVATNLSIFMSSEAKDTLLYKLLAKIDVFTIWEIFVLSIGLAVIYRFTTQKTATLVVVLWLIWVVISLTLGSLFGGFLRFGG